ncbi:AEC family transporter [Halalkalibacillus halophilus]|uniref:AEC family transporter n=1 Tax=Halalkalibacillus halophilus TaxID=392827 RepID=UPI0004118D44|nr:AEC family transporter [Halalkalibacillus halophilus]
MQLFAEIILPIIVIFLIGYLLQIWRRLDVRSVSAVTIYIFVPVLVFQTFLEADLGERFQTIVTFCFLLLAGLLLINKLISYLFRFSRDEESGIVLATAFMNAGNYGAPIILFAFGQEAFVIAVIFMSIQTLIMNFFGVYYASRGSSGIRFAFISVMKMPATYAILLAFTFRGFNWELGSNVMEMVDFMAAVAIPLMMVVLGMQLANISIREFEIGKVTIGTIVRLVISPLLAWGIVTMLGVSPEVASVLIILSATPSAAITTMYALEFRARPELVSSVTLVTTVISIVTISILLSVLV